MTVKQAKAKCEKLADEIDEELIKMERENKTDSARYQTLFYIAGCLREAADANFD